MRLVTTLSRASTASTTSIFRNIMRCGLALIGISTLLLSGRSAIAQPQSEHSSEPSAQLDVQDRDHWRKSMVHTLPSRKGCFTSSYPDTGWHETQCMPPPIHPYSTPRRPGKLYSVGSGTDFVATVSSGTISVGEGAFAKVLNVTSETDGGANIFSLQLNSQFFTTSACNGVSGCQGWEQFIYSSHAVNGAFIQNWLFNYGSTCPSGWHTAGGGNCYVNSSVVSVPSQTAEDLGQLILMGTASAGGSDAVLLYTASALYSATESDSTVDLASAWQTAEFNVVGDANLSEATFNPGATLVVRTNVANGTTDAPSCGASGTTGETNSLTLVTPCCPFGGTSPGIIFEESSASGATTTCSLLRNTWLPGMLTQLLKPASH